MNIDANQLMQILSKMDKKDLENGLAKMSQMLSAKDKEEILKKLNKN